MVRRVSLHSLVMFAASVSASLRINSRRSQLKQAHTLRSVLNRDQD